MRYGRVEDIIKLTMLMQSKYNGVSIEEVQDAFQVSRRTAERMRDALLNLFPQIEEVKNTGRVKRWRFPVSFTNSFVGFNAEELAELENAKKKYQIDGLNEKAETIDNIILKIKSMMKPNLTSIETDLEALMEAEGFAIRQQPRLKVNKKLLSDIRLAIKALRKIEIEYYSKSQNKTKKYTLHPYGILYSGKHYLVAFNEKKQEMNLYILAHIKNLQILDDYYDRDEEFSLAEYTSNSFGIYQEEPFDVELKFSQEVADDVMNYYFHPSQKMKLQKDGTVKVSFKAGGSYAICWHLFTWGKQVEVLKPKKLQKLYQELLTEAMNSIPVK